MRRLLLKAILLALPLVAAITMEVVVLPVDCFTFRAWEALRIDTFGDWLPGVFYPRMDLTRLEEGDLGHHSVNAVKKQVRWQTDRYGFRKQDRDRRAWPVVIIGDSTIAGSGLTQPEMLSEVLGDRLGVDVYPLAPADLNVFLDDERFTAHPPRTVIVECVERGVPDCLPEVPDTRRSGSPLRARLRQMRVVQRVAVRLDRAWKGTLRNYLRASFDRRVARVLGTRVEEAGGQPRMLFLHPAGLTEASDPAAAIAETIKRLKAFQRRLDRRGTRIVFLPIPEKENIHHGLLPSTGTAKPVFLARLITALRDAGIETVDTQTALDDAYRGDGRLLYHTDDTHWNGTGVRVVADAVAKVIGQRGGSGSAR